MNKTILITGASSGIGRELAIIAAQHKHNLILVARREDLLRELKIELEKKYTISVTIIDLDLSQANSAVELYQKINSDPDKSGGQNHIVDILINNAGFGDYGAFAETDDEKNTQMIQLNVATLTTLCRLFLPKMITRQSGKILNVASTAAFMPGPFMAVYFATKAFVLSFSEALSEETRGTGVHISVLCPGPTKTDFQNRAGTEKTQLFKGKIMTARTVAAIAYRGMMKNKKIIIPGWRHKFMIQLLRFSPRAVVTRVMRNILGN